jgi:hypothetical protein
MLSPQGLLSRAAVIVVVFLVLHVCGLREYTTLVTGTSPTGAPPGTASMALAMLYVAFHMGTVVLAPVMALAALLWAAYLYVRPPYQGYNGKSHSQGSPSAP